MSTPLSSAARPIVIASNRGPLSFRLDDVGRPFARRGAGGLVSGLAPLVAGTDTLWIAAALSDGDRAATTEGIIEAEGFRTRLVDIDPATYRMAYDVVCNATLWFIYHGLFDLARRPRFDHRFDEAWQAYRRLNEVFADAIAADAPADAVVLVQDYHLALVGPLLAERRPDVRSVHFSHTPFAGPDALRVLPDRYRIELLTGMAGHDACGFHTARWAAEFEASAAAEGVETSTVFVAPLASDPDDLEATARSAACDEAVADLDRMLGDRLLLARVDRIELSKNLLRGFHAYDDLLEHHPEWRERVVFGAFVYPSREGLPEYLAYRQEVESVIDRINARWRTPTWEPIVADLSDDFPRSVAALRRYDVLLVNPIRDGLNLVAKEGPLVNERDGVVLLSPEAGVWAELEGAVRPVHPYDVGATADAIAEALSASPEDRATESAELARRARLRTPADWLADQLAAVD